MAPTHITQIVLTERPNGPITSSSFRTEVISYDSVLREGQILVQTIYMSSDAGTRMRFEADGYMNKEAFGADPVEIGKPVMNLGIGKVTEVGKGCILVPGDFVYGYLYWRDWGVQNEATLQKVQPPDGIALVDFSRPFGRWWPFSVFCAQGLTEVGKLKAGDTLVISAAAGGVGHAACQVGKALGARVVGITGTDEKCKWLEDELGIDKAVNYNSPNFQQNFNAAAPRIDVFFDHVGGEILNAALSRLNRKARVVLCGSVSAYNTKGSKPAGVTELLNVIAQRANIEGFFLLDYAEKIPIAAEQLMKWIVEGQLKPKVQIFEGLEWGPKLLQIHLTSGNNVAMGKLVIQLADPNTPF